MSVDRIGGRRLERPDVTTSAERSGDSTLINCRTSRGVARIDRRAAGKERDRRGATPIIHKWAKLGIGGIPTSRRGKVATGAKADVVTRTMIARETVSAQ